MKTIINGKRYDTDTADLLCEEPCPFQPGDLKWHGTNLYRTHKGAFFLAGRGGAMSRWRESLGGNGWTGGSGIQPITAEEARNVLEWAGATDVIEALFEVEDA